jgi:hypothetical protein
MSDIALYEATRGVWRLGPRRERVRYALAVHSGLVQEVYEVVLWHPAGTTRYQTRSREEVNRPGRWEFTGSVAADPVRRRYVGKSVVEHLPKGAQNPVVYVGVP